MKFKFPKTITVGDTIFEIKYDKKSTGGSFIYPRKNKKGLITIGVETIKTNPNRFLNVVIHELKEIIQVEQDTRLYRNSEENSYVFHYSHAEHTDLCARLASLLTLFIK